MEVCIHPVSFFWGEGREGGGRVYKGLGTVVYLGIECGENSM